MSRRKGAIQLGWDDPDEAEAVAQVLHDAAIGFQGQVVDRGFYEDAEEIWRQVSQVRAEEAQDEAEL